MDGIRIRPVDSNSQSSTGKVPHLPGSNRSSTTSSTPSSDHSSSESDRRRPLGMPFSAGNNDSRHMRVRFGPSHSRLRSRVTPSSRTKLYDSGRRSQNRGARYVQYGEDPLLIEDKPPSRDETQAQTDRTQQANTIPSILAEPFFAWRLRQDQQTEPRNRSERNMMLIMNRLHISLSTGSMSKFYAKTYECTKKELLHRHIDTLHMHTEHSSKAVGTASLITAPQDDCCSESP